jgi:enterochelin esterase-like enzyme
MDMKKSIILGAALLLCAFSASAQQNLFISQDIQSAVVNEDHAVTFNFIAPDAKKVQVCDNQDFVQSASNALKAMLYELGQPYTYRESEGGHVWNNWRIYLSEFVPLLFK